MQLRPGFLEYTNPYLTVTACSEGWLTVRFAGQEVVDDDWSVLAIQEETHHIDASFVNLLSHEHGLDAMGHLGERAERRQEVAVAQTALVDITRLNTVFKDVNRVVDFSRPLPSVRIIGVSVDLVDVCIVERRALRRKIFISPGLTLFNRLIDHPLHVLGILLVLSEARLRLL